ncbi:MAG: hypothetical protein JOZ39_04155 [Chloroflexi bacterium]|nr:hypothetical protein [Chloroflexota bacterium]
MRHSRIGLPGGFLAGAILLSVAALPTQAAIKPPVPDTAVASGAAAIAPLPVGSPAPLVPPIPGTQASSQLRWVYVVGNTVPQSLRDHADQIDVISPQWFRADANGKLQGNDAPAVTQFARAHGIKVVPIVANGQFSEGVAHSLLSDGNRQTTLLDGLQWLMQNFGYDGVNIDFENVSQGDRDGFSALMSNVYARLHPMGKLVTAALPSKTHETFSGFSGPFDYTALAPNLDLALIMAYDQHYSGGPAGPIADVAWVSDVINFAKTEIPPSKILLGLPFYGYSWGPGGTRAMSYSDIVNAVFANGVQIQMDAASQSPTFSYAGRQVWFENSTSLKAKLNLVGNNGLAGWGGWRLGQEDPNFWTVVAGRQP